MTLAGLLSVVHLPTLIASLCGAEAVRGLNSDRGGVICDPRPGHQEKCPSFSVYRVSGGHWRWKRHGGDNAGGDAYALLLAFGLAPQEAISLLTQAAHMPAPFPRPRLSTSARRPSEIVGNRLHPLSPMELQRATALLAPLTSASPAAQELDRRGLLDWPDLQVGQLHRDFRAGDGHLLAHAGALAFFLTGPDGRPWGLKVRNLLKLPDLGRYVYRLGGHGAPAWCSPGHGTAERILIVEGELNAAAAARALSESGNRLDVQGLAGAGGLPHLEGCAGRDVYLYADADDAGRACVARIARLVTVAGARQVWMLHPLQSGDFCDLAGRGGLGQLRTELQHLLQAAVLHCPSTADEVHPHRTPPPHQAQGGDVVGPHELATSAWRKYQLKLRRAGRRR